MEHGAAGAISPVARLQRSEHFNKTRFPWWTFAGGFNPCKVVVYKLHFGLWTHARESSGSMRHKMVGHRLANGWPRWPTPELVLESAFAWIESVSAIWAIVTAWPRVCKNYALIMVQVTESILVRLARRSCCCSVEGTKVHKPTISNEQHGTGTTTGGEHEQEQILSTRLD
jgi:hypothetical protein